MKQYAIMFAALAAGVACASSMAAAAQPALTSVLHVEKVRRVHGKEVVGPVLRATPGEVLRYEAVYTSHDRATIRGLLVTLPVPAHTVFEPPRDKGMAPAQASIDGKHFVTYPAMRLVRTAGGAMVKKPVPDSQYRDLRWSIGTLAPGASKTVYMDVKVPAFTANDR